MQAKVHDCICSGTDRNSKRWVQVSILLYLINFKTLVCFSYGPWADRQRELLYKFFFPPDYQTMNATPEPKAGEKRVASMFQVRLSTQHVSTLDVLFSKAKVTKAVHVDIGKSIF